MDASNIETDFHMQSVKPSREHLPPRNSAFAEFVEDTFSANSHEHSHSTSPLVGDTILASHRENAPNLSRWNSTKSQLILSTSHPSHSHQISTPRDSTMQQFANSDHVMASAAAAAHPREEIIAFGIPSKFPNIAPATAFPHYPDGDVLVTSGVGKFWRLHSSYLSKYSTIIASLLQAEKAVHITKKQREAGITVKWRLEMRPLAENPKDYRLRTLALVDPKRGSTFRLNDDVAQGKDNYHKVYDNLFKCIYNIEPDLTNDQRTGGARYIADTIAILLAAEHLGALNNLASVLEGHLLRLGQTLWRHIAAKPTRWAYMAARMRSAVMFCEAMVHVIGKLDMKQDIEADWLRSNDLRRKILALAENKAKEMKAKKLEIERRLLEYYSPRMMHPQKGQSIPGRQIYAGDIYLWQARSAIQQYISSSYFQNLHHRNHDGGVQFYRTIGAGGEAYLGKDSLKVWYECFAMSGKAKVCFTDALHVIKEEMKKIVEDLLYDRSQAKMRAGEDQFPWLTCAKIFEEELPWET